MSVSDERFIRKQQISDDCDDHQLMNSTQSLKRYTKEEMLRFLNRVLDRNKPLFLFNSKVDDNRDGDTGTPSFSMIALIEKWKSFSSSELHQMWFLPSLQPVVIWSLTETSIQRQASRSFINDSIYDDVNTNILNSYKIA